MKTLILKITLLSVFMFICVHASMARLQTEFSTDSNARAFLASFFSKGNTSIDIRVNCIEDDELIESIKIGAKNRKFRIIIFKITDKSSRLIGLKNIDIRKSNNETKYVFADDEYTGSIVIEKGKDYFLEWFGPMVWNSDLNKMKTLFYSGSNEGKSSMFSITNKYFDQEFKKSPPVVKKGVISNSQCGLAKGNARVSALRCR